MKSNIRNVFLLAIIPSSIILGVLVYKDEVQDRSRTAITNSSNITVNVKNTTVDHGTVFINDSSAIFSPALEQCEIKGNDTVYFSKKSSILDYDPPYTLLKNENQNYIKLVKDKDTIVFCWLHSV